MYGISKIPYNWVGSEGCRHPSEGVTAEKCDEKEHFVASEGRSPYEKLRRAKRGVNLYHGGDQDLFELDVKIRYTYKKAKASLKQLGNDKVEVEFSEGQEAITPGQAAVFYDGEYVLGGGWIEKVLG